jgi:hypothetical protein
MARGRIFTTVRRLAWLLLLLSLAAGCSAPPRPPQVQATVDALSTAAVATVSTRLDGGPRAEVVPVQAGLARETQVAGVNQPPLPGLSESDRRATREAFPYLDALALYGADPDQGRPGWLHPPAALETRGPDGVKLENQHFATVAADFVLVADITWNTQAAEAGCGFVVRADGNPDSPSQYTLALTRFGGGQVYFTVQSAGKVISEHFLNPRGKDPAFRPENGATNRFAVVARGNNLEVYTNQSLVGAFDPNQPPVMPPLPPAPEEPADRSNPVALATYLKAKNEHDAMTNQVRARYNEQLRAFQSSEREFARGFTALAALARSGTAACTFENAWLWLIE